MSFDPVRLHDDLDWLMRPVLAGHMRLRELDDGTYSLNDVADLNDALDVEAENQSRAHAAAQAAAANR